MDKALLSAMVLRAVIILLTLTLGLTGCTTVIVPPPAPEDPQPVFILDHGRHTSLVLPDRTDGTVRYAYGDWEWYAMGETGTGRVFPTLFLRTASALGRRELDAAAEIPALRRAVHIRIDAVHRIEVEGQDIDRLREQLDRLFQDNIDTRVYNPGADLVFVHHPVPYSLLHNSNTMIADWLEQLGAQTRGPTLFALWRVSG